MPLAGGYFVDIWNISSSLSDAMNALVLYLTAFLASNPLLSNNGVQAVSAQYLLGLGKFLALFLFPSMPHSKLRNWRHNWVHMHTLDLSLDDTE